MYDEASSLSAGQRAVLYQKRLRSNPQGEYVALTTSIVTLGMSFARLGTEGSRMM